MPEHGTPHADLIGPVSVHVGQCLADPFQDNDMPLLSAQVYAGPAVTEQHPRLGGAAIPKELTYGLANEASARVSKR